MNTRVSRASIGVGHLAGAAALVAAFSGHALGAATQTRSYIGANDGKRVYDMPFMKLVGAEINGKFKNLNAVVSACSCGGFAEAAAKYLDGKYAVAVIRDTTRRAEMGKSNGMTYEGETGFTTGSLNRYVFGWDAQWSKKLNDAPNSTAKQLADAATANDFDRANHKNGFPKVVSKNSGEDEPVKVAPGAGEAIVWDNFDSDFFYATYATLQKSGYFDNTKENARIDSAFQSSNNRNFGGNNINAAGADPPVWCDRPADTPGLKTMVQGLATRLAADSGNKQAFVYVGGHGNSAKVKGDTLPNAAEGFAAQGEHITDGEGTSLELDTEFVAQLFEGTGIITADTTRVLPAAIELTTFSEDFAGSVEVFLDGIDIGSMSLTGSAIGGNYQVPISDVTMLQLFGTGVLDDLQADITFQFPQGVPSIDGFRVATEWDFDLGLAEFFGIGLAAPSVMAIAVPGPAAWIGVAACGALGVGRRRRRGPHGA